MGPSSNLLRLPTNPASTLAGTTSAPSTLWLWWTRMRQAPVTLT
ncbi:unnamed protein product [Linum tenue]|uniref:Uncharacterized protein n=1 Tax=Linum tenue TaxID=586396 RepID=A0AAV0IW98_9ROSI|nr:unnamed protein product [Linum tenue]